MNVNKGTVNNNEINESNENEGNENEGNESNEENEENDENYENEENEENEENDENEIPSNGESTKLCEQIRNMKYKLYESIIFSPNTDTKQSQDLSTIPYYLSNLNKVYELAIRAANNEEIKYKALKAFPDPAKYIINETFKWIYTFFKTNTATDTIPVRDYIEQSLKENQFIHRGGLFTYE